MVSDRGVRQIFTPVVWKISVPSRLHIFLWLLSNNKVLTRDNLAKRRHVNDMTCLFCSEFESVKHLFFDCCTAQFLWQTVAEVTGVGTGHDFESVAKCWLSEKKYRALNVCTTAVFWTLWKMRNDLCFQGLSWTGGHTLLRRCATMLRDWCLLNKPEDVAKLEMWATDRAGEEKLPTGEDNLGHDA
jgi:hypothetical protein